MGVGEEYVYIFIYCIYIYCIAMDDCLITAMWDKLIKIPNTYKQQSFVVKVLKNDPIIVVIFGGLNLCLVWHYVYLHDLSNGCPFHLFP